MLLFLWLNIIICSSLAILQLCSSLDGLCDGWRFIQFGIHLLLKNAGNFFLSTAKFILKSTWKCSDKRMRTAALSMMSI